MSSQLGVGHVKIMSNGNNDGNSFFLTFTFQYLMDWKFRVRDHVDKVSCMVLSESCSHTDTQIKRKQILSLNFFGVGNQQYSIIRLC